MRTRCPACQSLIDATPGTEVSCPACLSPFSVPALARKEANVDLQIDTNSVRRVGWYALREGIYTGSIQASARVRIGEEWEPVGAIEELAAIFRLRGEEPVPVAARKIKGWKGQEEEPSPPAAVPSAPKPTAAKPLITERPSAEKPTGKSPFASVPKPPPEAPAKKGAPVVVLAGLGLIGAAVIAGALWAFFAG